MRTHHWGMALAGVTLACVAWGSVSMRGPAHAAHGSVETSKIVQDVAGASASTKAAQATTAASHEREHAPAASSREHARSKSLATAPGTVPTMPTSLSEVELNPRQLAMLSRFNPLQRTLYEYKLGLLYRMRQCQGGLAGAKGKVSAFLHFRVDPATGLAEAERPELIDSSLPQGVDARALECLRKAHASTELDLRTEPLREDHFHWATDVVFPLDEDPAYELFAQVNEDNETEEEDE